MGNFASRVLTEIILIFQIDMKSEISFIVKTSSIDSLNFIRNFSSGNCSMPTDSFPELYRHNCSSGSIIKEGFTKVVQLSSGTVDF